MVKKNKIVSFLQTAVIVTAIFVSLTMLLNQNTTNYQDFALFVSSKIDLASIWW
jgi:hypothetical protein